MQNEVDEQDTVSSWVIPRASVQPEPFHVASLSRLVSATQKVAVGQLTDQISSRSSDGVTGRGVDQ
jgi:hypothetical protein